MSPNEVPPQRPMRALKQFLEFLSVRFSRQKQPGLSARVILVTIFSLGIFFWIVNSEFSLGLQSYVRLKWGIAYLLFPAVIFGSFWGSALWVRCQKFLKPMGWCFVWACLGIGASLINSRADLDKSTLGPNMVIHYVGYYGFAGILAALAAFSAGLYASRQTSFQVKFYSLAALVAIVLGFLSPNLRSIALKSLGLQ